jgi:hypothetical protein
MRPRPAVDLGMTSRDTTAAGGGGYPRTCGQCGTAFMAVRSHARWCSDRCRLRAWRQRNSSEAQKGEHEDPLALVQQVRTLQATWERAQGSDACAHNGCRLVRTTAADQARRQGDYDAQVSPWRRPEWEHPMVRTLRAKLTAQSAELDRLRKENGLLRRWVSAHVGQGKPGKAGT